MSTILPKKLLPSNRGALRRHFHTLGTDDRRLRFGSMISDAGIDQYVAQIDFDRDAIFGVFDDELNLSGAAHVAVTGGVAELGVSVLPDYRGSGVGSALFDRAATFARNQLVRILFMHCLTENQAMMHIAKKSGMRIVADRGEVDAHLELPPSDPASIARELMQDQVALFDYTLRSQVLSVRRISDAATGKPDER